jgi:hypothetical protein
MELCDTSSEAKQEGLIPVTIQGFATFFVMNPIWILIKIVCADCADYNGCTGFNNPFALVIDFLTFRPENFITLRDTPFTLYMYIYISYIFSLSSLVQIF